MSTVKLFTVFTQRGTNKGFTLIEITIAILILSVSLVTLIGMQSSIVQRSLFDKNRTAAMLAARRILADIEASDFPIDVGEKDAAISEFIDIGEEQLDTFTRRLRARRTVEYWDIPDNPKALKRVTVTVYWSEQPRDQITVYYFIPNDDDVVFGTDSEEEEAEEEDEE